MKFLKNSAFSKGFMRGLGSGLISFSILFAVVAMGFLGHVSLVPVLLEGGFLAAGLVAIFVSARMKTEADKGASAATPAAPTVSADTPALQSVKPAGNDFTAAAEKPACVGSPQVSAAKPVEPKV